MTTATEPASRRLAYLRRYDPLLHDLVANGEIADGDADLVVIAAQATERRMAVRLAVPGRSSELAGFVALDLAVRRLLDPGRYGTGTTALVTSVPWRKLLSLVAVAGEGITKGLGAVRLRRDGAVQELHGSRTRALVESDRLVLVTPRVAWPDLATALGTVVIDAAALGDAFDVAHAWATSNAEIVHVVATLDPTLAPAGAEIDWPWVWTEQQRWGRGHAWPSAGLLRVEIVGAAPQGLEEARREIADRAKDSTSWPAQLVAAASLSRALASVAVPLSLYDAHTAKTIASSFADRVEALEAVRPGDFPSAWTAFAQTTWPVIKRQLLDAASALDQDNPKAPAIGLAVERFLAEGYDVTIWANSIVHARAIETHLLTAGFGLGADDFESGRIVVDVLGTKGPLDRHQNAAVLTGLPTNWQAPAVISDRLGSPLGVLAYHFEATRAPGYFGWLLNGNRLERHTARVILLEGVLGPGTDGGAAPPPVELTIEQHDLETGMVPGTVELGVDAAELAALADDEWLALALERRERATMPLDDTMRTALAFLVEPGPGVLLVAEHSLVDRLVAGRLRPMPAGALMPGMTILGGASGGETVFDRVRPYLDRLHGTGTRFWLDRWDDALVAALRASGGRLGLVRALVEGGASITAAAVGAWPSPYRIGPRDEANVVRVADIGGSVIVSRNARRVHAVMRGVRIENSKLGRLLSSAVRRHLAGDADAFDPVEDLLDTAIEEVLGEVSVASIRDCLGPGRAPGSKLGRIHPPATAERYFTPEI